MRYLKTQPRIAFRGARLACGLFTIALLGACANMSETPPGASLASVEQKWGSHDFSCPGPGNTRRVLWTQQPYGQHAWSANVDAAGNIDRIEPVLTDKHFEKLASGTWTPEQVQCEFGPPAEESTVGLPSSSQIVWSYRYRQANVWNSLMHVYFGTDGERVTRFHPGPDPLFDHGDEVWMN